MLAASLGTEISIIRRKKAKTRAQGVGIKVGDQEGHQVRWRQPTPLRISSGYSKASCCRKFASSQYYKALTHVHEQMHWPFAKLPFTSVRIFPAETLFRVRPAWMVGVHWKRLRFSSFPHIRSMTAFPFIRAQSPISAPSPIRAQSSREHRLP
jgi:hypothetical protein